MVLQHQVEYRNRMETWRCHLLHQVELPNRMEWLDLRQNLQKFLECLQLFLGYVNHPIICNLIRFVN